jgi:hypothetical protein
MTEPGKIYRFLILIVFLVYFAFPSFAQDQGTVTVVKDAKIDMLIARKQELERETWGSRITAEGYRVQIFSGSDRARAYQEQAKFKSIYPQLNTYISYAQPNYKIRVGDFRGRLEAEKFMNQLRKTYPSLFIFPERINLSR